MGTWFLTAVTAPCSLQSKSSGRSSVGKIGAVLASDGNLRRLLSPRNDFLNSDGVRSENWVTPWVADGSIFWCRCARRRFLLNTLNLCSCSSCDPYDLPYLRLNSSKWRCSAPNRSSAPPTTCRIKESDSNSDPDSDEVVAAETTTNRKRREKRDTRQSIGSETE